MQTASRPPLRPDLSCAVEVKSILDRLYSTSRVTFRRLFLLEGIVGLENSIAEPLIRARIIESTHKGYFSNFRILQYDDLYLFSDLFSSPFQERVYPAYEDQGIQLAEALIVNPGENALDIGTGSGILAFKLAKAGARVVACDLNERSIALAKFGAVVNGLDEQITFVHESYSQVTDQFAIIVSNPPFTPVPEPDSWYWPAEGRSGQDGLDVFRGIIAHLPKISKHDTRIYFLINSLGNEVESEALRIISEKFPDSNVEARNLYIPEAIPLFEYTRRFRSSSRYREWISFLADQKLTHLYRHIVSIDTGDSKDFRKLDGRLHTINRLEIFGRKPQEVESYESGGWQETLLRYGNRKSLERKEEHASEWPRVMLIEDDDSFAAALAGLLGLQGIHCNPIYSSQNQIQTLLDSLNDEEALIKIFKNQKFILLDLGLKPDDRAVYDQAYIADRDSGNNAKNQREALVKLESISGIRVLRAIQRSEVLSRQLRVILISRFDEKFLAAQALDASAFAFISKYSNYRDNSPDKLLSLSHSSIVNSGLRDIFRGDATALQIRHTIERAARDLTLQALTSHVPGSVVSWIAKENQKLDQVKRIRATLLLVDISGSSALLKATADAGRPELFGKILNSVLGHANEAVAIHGGEINAFTGDGFLAFFNVYSDDPDHIESAIQAAFSIRETFRSRTKSLIRSITKDVPSVTERNKITSLISDRVGLRLGLITTDDVGSIIATVGHQDRCQHTIISPQMNVLSRALDALGSQVRDCPPEEKSSKGLKDPIILVTQDKVSSAEELDRIGFRAKEMALGSLRDFESGGYGVVLIEK